MSVLYVYAKCSTCREALQWLASHHITVQVKAIRETPPSVAELKAALDFMGGDIRKLFNTSGLDYRALGLKDRLATMSEEESLQLLSQNGNLIKRPFLIGDGRALAGFKPEVWRQLLLS
jgi:arsenate reductase